MMRPIPRHLLIHQATLRKYTGLDAMQQPIYSPDVQLTHVRVEPSSKIVTTKDNIQRQLNSLLFFDCQNSSPKAVDFNELDLVVFEGRERLVVWVEALYAYGSKPHHYEVGLV